MLLATMNQLNVLLNHLTAAYFANLTSVLIVYDSSYRLSTCNDYDAVNKFCLQELYLDAIQHAFDQQTQRGHVIGLQWIDTRSLNSTQYEEVILNAVNLVTKGFITALTNTTAFVHARYSATRNARLRLKYKYYLFLGEHEDPIVGRFDPILIPLKRGATLKFDLKEKGNVLQIHSLSQTDVEYFFKETDG
uniref:Uncharacterized protein n=1 Tax=Glossina pallidipes TaxID=7398 RepID=A0A1A9ZBL3_GLOPL